MTKRKTDAAVETHDAPVLEAPATVRLRMLKAASTQLGYLRPGMTVNVPHEMAQGWLRAGLAEEDKALDGPPETK